jgi:hypothetical protein
MNIGAVLFSSVPPSRTPNFHDFEFAFCPNPKSFQAPPKVHLFPVAIFEMAGKPQSIICKSCAETIATVSGTGLAPATDGTGCETCKQFRPMYDAMQAADVEYASFAQKPDNYKPKQAARVNVTTTHMQLDNFLISVERAVEDPALLANTGADSKDHSMAEEELHGTKRSRSSSSNSNDQSPVPPPRVHGISSLPARKRIQFSDSVEFRDDYRPSQHYSRNDEAYERGRYAPSQGGDHLDTSGHDKTFLKFTGMKKVGKKWVNVWKENDEDEREDGEKELSSKDMTTPDIETINASKTVHDHAMQSENTSIGQRLVRRSSRTPQSVPTQNDVIAKQGRRQTKSTKMQVLSTNISLSTQPIGTAIATIKDDGMTEAHTAKSCLSDKDEDMQSSSAQSDQRATTGTAASPLSTPLKDLTGESITGQRNPGITTAGGTVEEHALQGQNMADKNGRQLAHDKHNARSKTNFARAGEQMRAECEATEQLGVADGPLAASKRADEPDGAEGDPPE